MLKSLKEYRCAQCAQKTESEAGPKKAKAKTVGDTRMPVVEGKIVGELEERVRQTVVMGFVNVLAGHFEATHYSSCAELCQALEVALFQSHAEAQKCGPRYKSKYRTLQFNLKDPKNTPLRTALMRGDISPVRLMAMTAAEMANEEVQKEIQRVREDSVTQLVMGGERVGSGEMGGRAYVKKTHKGEDYLPMGLDAEEAFGGRVAFNGGDYERHKEAHDDANDHASYPRLETIDGSAPLLETLHSNEGSLSRIEETNEESGPGGTVSVGQWQGKIYIAELGRIPAVATFIASSPSPYPPSSLSRFLPHNLHLSGRLPIPVAAAYTHQIWEASSSRDVLLFSLKDPLAGPQGGVSEVVRWLGEQERWAVVAHDAARGIRDFYLAPAVAGCRMPPCEGDERGQGGGGYGELVGVLVIGRDGRPQAPTMAPDLLYDPHPK